MLFQYVIFHGELNKISLLFYVIESAMMGTMEVGHDTEEEDMDQDTAESDLSDDESESSSGSDEEDESGNYICAVEITW